MARQGHHVGKVVAGDMAQAHIGDTHYHTAAQPQADAYQALLTSLTFDGMDVRIRNVALALPTTCEWLPYHRDFVAWIDSKQIHNHNGFLWLKGKPGSGKSTVMKETLSWAQREWSDQIVLSYFFNARSPHLLERSSLGLYRSLLWQLQVASSATHTTFVEQFASKLRQKQTDGRKEMEVEQWTEIELQNFLIVMIKKLCLPQVTIFIDALDEGVEDDVQRMVRFLERLTQHAATALRPVRMCLSSRHYPHISVQKSLSLVLEDQREHDWDLELYIRSELTGGNILEMDELRQKVRERSAGIFLWVVLVIPILNQAYDQGKSAVVMIQKLDTIPRELCDLFTQVLFRDTEDLNECVALLQWVLYAKRPLSPIELYCAIHHTCFPNSEKSDTTTIDVAVRYLRRCSRGLVELTKTKEPVVQFIHETIRNYLTNEDAVNQRGSRVPTSIVSAQDFQESTCHEKLAEACLRYLLQSHTQISLIEDIQRLYPLVSYTTQYWWKHLYASPSPCNTSVVKLALCLIADGTDVLRFWLTLCSIGFDYDPVGRCELVRGVLDLGVDVNVRGGRYGTALAVASACGHAEVVQILLDAGALNSVWDVHCTALEAASEQGQGRIVQILINAGVNVNDQRSKYGALPLAARHGHERVVQMLLDAGANVDLQTQSGTALCEASRLGYDKMLQMLIDAGADVNLEEKFGTALYVASKRGHEKVVRMLIDAGADVDYQGRYATVLYEASDSGHEKIVQMLIDAGANANKQGGRYGTPLAVATRRGHKKVMHILLAAAVDVGNGGSRYGTAIDVATDCGQEEILQTLMENRASLT